MSDRESTFVEVCLYEVKPERAEEFEHLLDEVSRHHAAAPGVVDVRYMRRTHRQGDFRSVKEGQPAKPLVRAGKSITYVLYWELRDEVAHGKATKSGLGRFYSRFRRCLATAPKILLGRRLA